MSTTTQQSATMSVEQAGILFGISRRSAYRAAANGHLPTIRLGRRLLVPTRKLYALLGIPHRPPHRQRRHPQRHRRGSRHQPGGRRSAMTLSIVVF